MANRWIDRYLSVRHLIRKFDRWLRRRMEVFEYSDDPQCIFRVRVAQAPHPLKVPGGKVPAGAKVLEMHFWNEHLPPLSRNGPNMAWAARTARMMVLSCHQLASRLADDPRLGGVEAVGGVTSLFVPGQGSGAERVFTRLGFAAAPQPNRWGPFGEFWENVHAWMLMWAFNAASLRHHTLLRMRRTEFWASTDRFVRIHTP
jgi:hypothetical protein